MPASRCRQLILNEARTAFLEAGEGINGVSARAIAQRCGVDQALIFRHFGKPNSLSPEAGQPS
jgi:AcrR family transcriptional regulator